MVWNKTYYEEDEYEALKNTAGVGSLNQEVMDSLEKIIVCDTTTLFRNGNENHPFNVVWKSSIKKIKIFISIGIVPRNRKNFEAYIEIYNK